MRTRIGILVTGLAVAVALPGVAQAAPGTAPAPQAPAPQASAKKTIVKTFTPFTKAGTLKRVTLPTDLNPADCVPSSVAAAKNIYSCGSAADYLPACWTAPKLFGYAAMVCLSSPQDKSYQVVASDRMPKKTAKPRAAEPWQIRLDDGGVCAVRMGGTFRPPPGYQYSYLCSGSTIEALVTPDDGPLLNTATARYTVLGAKSLTSARFTKVGVKKVIYAGAAPKRATKPAKVRATCPADALLNRTLPRSWTLDSSTRTVCVGRWAGRMVDTAGAPVPGFVVFKRAANRSWKYLNIYVKNCQRTHAAFVTMCAMPVD